MARILLVLVLFSGLIVTANILQVRKIKEQTPVNAYLRLKQQLSGITPYLKEHQYITYVGERFINEKEYYFLSTNILAPRYTLLQEHFTTQTTDTVLGIFKTGDPRLDSITSGIKVLWQKTDEDLVCFLGHKSKS